jgi:HlyD family secretion protein
MPGWKSLVAAVAVVALGAGGWYLKSRKAEQAPKFRTQKVERGDVVSSVAATGTLSAVTTVKVGSEVSGIVSRLLVDFNSEVRKGQLLAELDPTTFQAQVDQRRADLDKGKVEARNAAIAFERARKLLAQQLISQSEFDIADLNLKSANASVAQAEATLRQAATNLARARIHSPIDGVVVDRQYDVGQTVAASFQAPTLFTIAQDLTKMQVAINVDEADVGRIREGQPARFTVDAFPDQSFAGRISQVRLAPQTVQNVVTYPVLLDVANPRLELKPGMTASVSIPVESRSDVVRVPNAALRFRPDPSLLPGGGKGNGNGDGNGKRGEGRRGSASPAPAASALSAAPAEAGERGAERRPEGVAGQPGEGRRRGAGEGMGHAGRPGRPGEEGRRPGEAGLAADAGAEGRRPTGGGRPGTIYKLDPTGKLQPVQVRTSITDGNFTALDSGELREGDEVVIGLATSKAMEASGSAPGMGGRPGGGMGRH